MTPRPAPATVLSREGAPAGAEAALALDEAATLAKAGAENFPVASRLLPGRARAHLLALYGFARAVDDLGDLAPGDRDAKLDRFEAELDLALAGAASDPILARVAATVTAVGADRSLLDRLIAANRQDQRVSRYDTFEELLAYCELSANPVGRLVLAVFGVGGDRAGALSDKVCSGLQVVEHLQDVAEDRRAGRVYLPRRDMDRFGVDEADLDAAVASPALRRLVAFEVGRARELLLDGSPLVGLVPGRARLAVAGFVGGGLAQLEAIEAARFDVQAVQAKASRIAVLARAVTVLAGARARR